MITAEVVDFSATTKPEGNTTSDHRNVNLKVTAATPTSSSSSSWTRLKDPRIVRVSRAFGGKDRHSKVCTVRGLRDRRVRLSVPTAIQLYDLQDRLGLNQPSKVVDWLLNAAKHEIDELPPLQLPPTGNFNPNLQQWLCSQAQHTIKQGLPLQPSTSMRDKSKEVTGDNHHDVDDDDDDDDDDSQDQNWTRKSEEGKQPQPQPHQQQQSHNIDPNSSLFPRSHNSSSSSLPSLMNNPAQFNSFQRWDLSSLSLSQGGVSVPQPDQGFHNFNNVLPSFFHPQSIGGAEEFEPSRQMNFQMLSSGSHHPSQLRPPPIHDFTSHSLRPLHFLASHHSLSGSKPNKENDQFHSS